MPKINLHLFFITFILLSSCAEQKKSQPVKNTTNAVDTFTHSGEIVNETGANIMIVYQDKNNNYWLGSWIDGLYKYNGKTLVHFTTKDGLPHNRINEIKEDQLGNLFFNTSNGLSKYDGKQFTTVPVVRTNQWKIQANDLWFKYESDSGHVGRYDGKVLHRLTFPSITFNGEIIRENAQMKNSPYSVYTIYTDRRGNIWFGTAALGVCYYNGIEHAWITSGDVNEMHNGPANGVRSILEDKEGDFWFCNTIYTYTVYPKEGSAKQDQPTFNYTRKNGIGNLIPNDSTSREYLSATLDTNGHVWIARYRDGVYEYDGKTIHHHPVQANGKDITVFSIYTDHYGQLWLGTEANGAFTFNGKTFEKFKPYENR